MQKFAVSYLLICVVAVLLFMHKLYQRYISVFSVTTSSLAVLFLSSFAIFLRRELRWNSWDVILQPAKVLADSGAILFFPFAHLGAWSMIFSFFSVLATLYLFTWQLLLKVRNVD